METPIVLAIAAGALVLGLLIGWLIYRASPERRSGAIEEQAKELLETAKRDAEATRRQAELDARDAVFRAKEAAEAEAKERLASVQRQRTQLVQREESLEERSTLLDKKDLELASKERDLGKRERAAESAAQAAQESLAKAEQRLEQVAQLSAEQAREILVEQMRDEAKQAAAAEIRRIEAETEAEARERSVNIIATSIQRYASDFVSERTVAVVQLPGDDMKGRIIGREGRNIRALEAATGVDLIIDDTPEAVILSCFNPVRREVARLALTRLLSDGRIHPSRIEEVVKRCTEEVDAGCKEAGEQAVYDLGLHKVHPELIRLLGQQKFLSSHSQNLLQHSIEVGYIAGLMASELRMSVKQARRAGLLHDIGKAVDHEAEGSHAAAGANLAKKYGESAKVVHAIAAHHGEIEQTSVLAILVDAANSLSGRRPGARRQRLQSYVQRLNEMEELCKKYAGVERALAIQAGREVRVIVANDEISDDMAVMLSKDIARQIEKEMTYPGQIMVSVLRESRASDIAR